MPVHTLSAADALARLADFDRSLEEAAMDLGATPWVTFRTITLPLIAPALAMGNTVVLVPSERSPLSVTSQTPSPRSKRSGARL